VLAWFQSTHVPVWVILNLQGGRGQSSNWLNLTKDMKQKCHG
jgi:hypothetical protein